MRNKNLFIMKQPALGKKISDLRKQQGLTQEELVEQCNINVRTIQRIEAGEVTPRSYTLKSILGVLGVNIENIDENEINDNFTPILGVKPDNKYSVLKLSWIFGILYFFLGFPEVISEYYRVEESKKILSLAMYIFIKIASVGSFFFFIRGFLAAGKIYKNNILSITSIIALVSVLVFSIYDVLSFYFSVEWFAFLLIIKSVLYGILLIILGIGVMQLYKNYSAFAIVTGVFEILAGFAFLIIIPELGISLLFPMQLLEIILIYKIADKQL